MFWRFMGGGGGGGGRFMDVVGGGGGGRRQVRQPTPARLMFWWWGEAAIAPAHACHAGIALAFELFHKRSSPGFVGAARASQSVRLR